MLNKFIYRFLLLIINIRLPIFDRIRAACVIRLTNSPRSNNLVIMSGVFFEDCQNINLGSNISINQDCFISGCGGIKIGDEVSIGHRVSILSTEHCYDNIDIPIRKQRLNYESVEIGNNVWIGANVTILAGVSIPDGCIIGAGSVVTKKLDKKNAIYVGNPVRYLKSRFE